MIIRRSQKTRTAVALVPRGYMRATTNYWGLGLLTKARAHGRDPAAARTFTCSSSSSVATV
eukprot:CAMPEP_0195128738 /NCGR_PEP_ID=MMETSP0448-20130528/139818_1 /TAXON_ID=66468 /ORGANISM="Heterocapsa triquestra, Strain CCMP 448" /LENGTH=60 /DNA_ID=CAMNT_0040166553 /DNA_START=180 /DNA_END=362 /DNA_ORIENTATION=+